jgi:hypothetical protein
MVLMAKKSEADPSLIAQDDFVGKWDRLAWEMGTK